MVLWARDAIVIQQQKGRRMRSFEFVEPATLEEVLGLLQGETRQTRLIAGGSDLLGEMKDDVVHYERLVSLAGITALQDLHQDETGLRLGALVTIAGEGYVEYSGDPKTNLRVTSTLRVRERVFVASPTGPVPVMGIERSRSAAQCAELN